MHKIVLFWFRRDLRLNDNTGLYHALRNGFPVLPVFVFDTGILNTLPSGDNRLPFLYQTIESLKKQLEKRGSSLRVCFGEPLEIFRSLTDEYPVQEVFANHDYEPYARSRDKKLEFLFKAKNIGFRTFKDHLIFEKSEITKEDGSPYQVFTPYSKKWKQKYSDKNTTPFDSESLKGNFYQCPPFEMPSLERLGFSGPGTEVPSPEIDRERIRRYADSRDFPALEGTTRLGVHLRFGTISIRELTRVAADLSEVFFNELIWRNFFADILWHYPRVKSEPFKKPYAFIEWRNNEPEFARWCRGATGYPLVDAGMRELNHTGFMHNRVRMVVAGFLVKHLLIDWRWGEAYFAEKLLDYELASNNGNWQWAAGTGCDAVPYFRVFNPLSQQKKFDGKQQYIRKWIPELDTPDYPSPVVDLAFARQRAIQTYKKALNSA
jgi:deoxyribodipyrimidine photo-lyase